MKPIPSVISNEALDLMQKARTMITRIDALTKAKCPKCGKGDCKCKDCPDCGKGKCNCKANNVTKAGDTFTIGDQLRENNDGPPQGSKPTNRKHINADDAHGEYDEEASLDSMDAEEDLREKPVTDAEEMSGTLPLSEGPSRDHKRGDRNLGVQVKRPGFRSNEQMPMDDASAKTMAKSGDEGSQPTFNTSFSTIPQDIAFVSESGGQTRNAGYSTNQHLLDSETVTNKGATSVSVSLEKLASMLNPHEGGGSSRLDDNGVLKSVCEQCGGNQYSGCRGNCPNKKNLN